MANSDIAIVMPFLYINEEVTEKRLKYIDTWRNYDGSVPLIILQMNYDKKLIDAPWCKCYYLDRGLPAFSARPLLSEIARKEGFSDVLQIDDDFEILPNSSYGKDILTCYELSSKPLWFNAANRLIFTACRNRQTVFGFCNLVSDSSRDVPADSKIWEYKGINSGNYYNTREGFSHKSDEYVEITMKSIETINNKSITDYYLLHGEDCLMLFGNAIVYGIELRKVKGVRHRNTFGYQKKKREHDLKYSVCWNTSIETPISKFRRLNDIDGAIDLLRNSNKLVDQVKII